MPALCPLCDTWVDDVNLVYIEALDAAVCPRCERFHELDNDPEYRGWDAEYNERCRELAEERRFEAWAEERAMKA